MICLKEALSQEEVAGTTERYYISQHHEVTSSSIFRRCRQNALQLSRGRVSLFEEEEEEQTLHSPPKTIKPWGGVAAVHLQKPVKKKPWHQEKVAVEYGPPCIQFMDFHRTDRYSAANMERENEDCLFLNVFAPYVSSAGCRYSFRTPRTRASSTLFLSGSMEALSLPDRAIRVLTWR